MKIKLSFWPAGIILMLVAFFCGIMAMVFIASAHQTDLVSDNYYAQEIQYQQRIDGLARAKKAGASVRYDADHHQILVKLGENGVKPDAPARLELYRPSASRLDQELPLLPDLNGSQAANVAQLPTGPWQAQISWNISGKPFLLETSFTNGPAIVKSVAR